MATNVNVTLHTQEITVTYVSANFFYLVKFGTFRGVKDGIATYKWHCSSACKAYEAYKSKSPFYSLKRARAMTAYSFLGIESIYIKYLNAFIIIMIIMIKVNIKFSPFLLMPENNPCL